MAGFSFPEQQKPRGGRGFALLKTPGFLFLPYKFRIAGSEAKTANFGGLEGPFYQRLLLWGSGGKLT
jgi:hypothetical protein